jgi:predicted metal-binding membrane protein
LSFSFDSLALPSIPSIDENQRSHRTSRIADRYDTICRMEMRTTEGRRPLTGLAAGLIVVTLLCWAWIVAMARDMYGAMTGPSAWMMTMTWDATHVLLLWAMWAVMMAGMMLPSAWPLLRLYALAAERSPDRRTSTRRAFAVGAGYLLVWMLFSVCATLLQRALSRTLLLTSMMEIATPRAAAALLLLSGVYQLTPLKAACLGLCRSPASIVAFRWRAGATGALRMGIEHGLYCLGCCWALMLLLFAGGVMNLAVIAAITAVVLVEKIAPFGAQTSRATGTVLIALGAWAWAFTR